MTHEGDDRHTGEAADSVGGPDAPSLTTAEHLRHLSIPHQMGGYSRDAVDELLDRAAQTIEKLLGEVHAQKDEIAQLSSSRAEFEEKLELAGRRSPEEIVGDVLMTAHRAADGVLEKAQQDAAWAAAEARRETLPVLADAQRILENAERLHRDAQATVAEARLHADALLEAARGEQEQLLAGVASRRAELEVDNMRLAAAIKGLRLEWAARAAEALARLDGIGLEAGPSPGEADADRSGALGLGERAGSHDRELARDLQSRLSEGDQPGAAVDDI
jgi:cell division septum initiation protein DivIVA